MLFRKDPSFNASSKVELFTNPFPKYRVFNRTQNFCKMVQVIWDIFELCVLYTPPYVSTFKISWHLYFVKMIQSRILCKYTDIMEEMCLSIKRPSTVSAWIFKTCIYWKFFIFLPSWMIIHGYLLYNYREQKRQQIEIIFE